MAGDGGDAPTTRDKARESEREPGEESELEREREGIKMK